MCIRDRYKEDTVTEVDKMGSAYKIVNLTPEEIMECSKTAKVKDWDQRTYDITIDAASKVSNTTITTQKQMCIRDSSYTNTTKPECQGKN